MSFFYPLCSSSKGNSSFIGNEQGGIIIDVGISFRALQQSLGFRGIPLDAIKAIFITHEHSDHIKGLKTIGAKLNVPIYGSSETLHAIIHSENAPPNAECFEIKNKAVSILDMEITAFETPHDTKKSLGYKINLNDLKSISICTDLGHVSDEVYSSIEGSNLVLLESNYDDEMLKYGLYPSFLKKRISSLKGHLSNDESAKTVARLLKNGTSRFVLGHLSENNNTPILAYQAALSALVNVGGEIERDFTLEVATPKNLGRIVELC